MPSAASSLSMTYCGIVQRLGLLASLTFVISGGASCVCAGQRVSHQISPAVAVVAAVNRNSRLLGNISASRFDGTPSPFRPHYTQRFHRGRRNGLCNYFSTTLSDSALQARGRHGSSAKAQEY